MKLKAGTLRKIMRKATSRPIEASAIMLMASEIEKLIILKTLEAETTLLRKNELRRNQGLRQRVRLSAEEVQAVMRKQ